MPADSAGADTPGNTYVNYTIIGACSQPKDHARSKGALVLGALLRHLSTMTFERVLRIPKHWCIA